MELASGGDLSRWVQSPPPWATLRDAIGQLLDALAHAHARGLVHRDLKPGNVLLRGRRDRLRGVALTDLGLAISAQDRAEGVLASAGTPRYMAPEQAQGSCTPSGPGRICMASARWSGPSPKEARPRVRTRSASPWPGTRPASPRRRASGVGSAVCSPPRLGADPGTRRRRPRGLAPWRAASGARGAGWPGVWPKERPAR
jgi:hypothetical protein